MPHDSPGCLPLVKQMENLAIDKTTAASYRLKKGGLDGVHDGDVQDPYLWKESQDSTSQLLFPFLLKIDPNTLCIIQKFHSLVAVTGKTGPSAPMIHCLQRTGSQGAVAKPLGMPIKTALSGNSQLGVGAVLGTAFPTPPNGKD